MSSVNPSPHALVAATVPDRAFISPGWLWLWLVVAALAVAYVVLQVMGRKKYEVRFTNVDLLDKVAPKRPGWRRHVPAVCLLAGLTVGVVAVARPVAEVDVPKERATVILAVDTSLSMQATDVRPDRIRAAKKAAKKFIESMPPKYSLGLVSFNGSTTVEVTPTTDRAAVLRAIQRLELDQGTAIGDAVKTSLDTIRRFQASSAEKGADRAPAAIVLLSDGETTVGLPTEEAIPLAKAAKVPVSTIAYGTENGTITVQDEAGFTQTVNVPVARKPLAELASGTDGKAFTAESANDLTSVYKKLGSSLGTDRERQEITWRWALAALGLLALSSVLSLVWFSRLP